MNSPKSPAPFNPLDHLAFLDEPEWLNPESAWHEHIPFAFWIMDAAKPRVLVELGTHKGDSYFAFCQFAKRYELNTRCHAIDTWEGDSHAGRYERSLYLQVKEHNDSHYSSFSTLHPMLFDDALSQFENGSIDLLHIDGLHTYEAVKHDFETWLPKISPNGIILFHDTAERGSDFGVWRLWEELESKYPSLNFEHGHGLGVLGVGESIPAPVANLLASAPDQQSRAKVLFSQLGGLLASRFAARVSLERQQMDFQNLLEDRTKAQTIIEDQARHLEEQQQQNAELKQHLEALSAREAALRERLLQGEQARNTPFATRLTRKLTKLFKQRESQ